jgi:collagenase-like PrtC family protease
MKYFNVPADFKNETIDRYDQLNNAYNDSKVIETYGQITIDNPIGSGRAYDLIPQVDMATLNRYIQYSREKNIGFNYSLNTTCFGNKEFTPGGMAEILRFLNDLYEAGVRSLTIALPSLIELVRLTKYDFEIKASTLCQVINANKAMAYKKMGVDMVIIDESINRDFGALTQIRDAFGEKIEIIANVICHKNCIYEMYHHNQVSHDMGNSAEQSVTYYSHRCMMKRCEDAANLMKQNWIRPEDIKYYTAVGIHYFKLQGRQAVLKGDPLRAAECYFKESYQGNLLELLDMFSPTNSFMVYLDNRKLDGYIKPFVEKPGFCKNYCANCRYCDIFVEKCLDMKKTAETFDLAAEFYLKYDHFINMAKTVKPGKKKEKNEKVSKPPKKLLQPKNLEMDFNF